MFSVQLATTNERVIMMVVAMTWSHLLWRNQM